MESSNQKQEKKKSRKTNSIILSPDKVSVNKKRKTNELTQKLKKNLNLKNGVLNEIKQHKINKVLDEKEQKFEPDNSHSLNKELIETIISQVLNY